MATGWKNKLFGWAMEEAHHQQVWETLTKEIYGTRWRSASGRCRSKGAGHVNAGWTGIQCLQRRKRRIKSVAFTGWTGTLSSSLLILAWSWPVEDLWLVRPFLPFPFLILSFSLHIPLYRHFNIHEANQSVFPNTKLWSETYSLN